MFSPVAKRIQRNKENSSGRLSPSKSKTRLEELKGQNSFRSMASPAKSPEKDSTEEPCTPKISDLKLNSLPKAKRMSSTMSLEVDVDVGVVGGGSSDLDDDEMLASTNPSPIITNYHHNYKDKFKPPENKAYRFSCAGEVERPQLLSGTGSPHDRRYNKKKSKKYDKHVSYSAEYLRPIEEFIYPSLRPSTEELKKKREDAKKNMDFSVPDFNGPVRYDLQWKITESESKVTKPDVSSTLLYKIGVKGENKLRDSIKTTCLRKIKVEEEYKRSEDNSDLSTGMQKVIRKANIMGNLFGRQATIIPPEEMGFNGSGNPFDVYYGLYKTNKQRDEDTMLSETKGMVSQSRVEACYDMNAEELRSTMPGFNESNDHFNGVMYYKIKNSMSESKVNDMLSNCASPLAMISRSESRDFPCDMGGKSSAAVITSSIAKRQNMFAKQRANSKIDYAEDPAETDRMMEEHAKMSTILPATKISSEYSCSVLSRIKRVSRTIFNNADAANFSGDTGENDSHFDSDQWAMSTVEQKKRHAQDTLLFREIKSGLIPEQLLKKIPRMGALVSLDLSYYSLGDELCACLGKSLAGLEMLHTMGMRANRLTFKSLNVIFTHVNVKSFRHLDVSMNEVGGSAIPTLCELLMRPDCRLTSLELERTGLNFKSVSKICDAIKFPETSLIMELSLARNSLGRKAMTAIADLLKYPGCSVSWLDLSWNSFDSDSGACLAEALTVNQTLTSLDLSANSLRDSGGQRIAACLLQNKSLQEIFLSLNNIGGKSCFIFSKVLRGHPSMSRLNLSDNPLTDAGARSIFRTILRGLKCFVMMQNCTFTSESGLFNHSNPSLDSPYSLNLSEPYQLSVLSELIHMVNVNKFCRFSHLTYKEKENDSKYIDISVDVVNGETFLCHGSTPWPIPTTGILKLHISHRPRIPTLDMALDDLAYNTILAIVVNARSESDRKNWLFLMCMDAYFTTEQAQDLIDILADHHLIGGGGISIVEFCYCLWSNLIDVVNVYDFYHRNLDETKRLSLIHSLSFEKFRFNWVNPSGHWRLDLGNKVQRSVMMQLIALNGSENKASKRAKRGDTSQKGNYCNFRNERLAGVEVEINIEYTKALPWSGVLEFDYVTTTRMHPTTEVISDDDFVTLLNNLEISPRRRLSSSSSNFKLMELQLAVTKYYFTTDNILKVMNCFSEDPTTQVRVVVCMFGRLVELHNFDAILRHMNASAIQNVLNRLGVLNCLNPLKPCLDLRLNLKYKDNRILVHSYLQMSSAEGGDQLKQHPRSDLDIIALYAQMGRLIGDTIEGYLMFTYCEVGEREAPLDWKLRKDAVHNFLVGNQPRHSQMFKIVQMYKEIKGAGLLTLGPLDIQYADYKKTMAIKKLAAPAKGFGKGARGALLSSTMSSAKK